MADIVGLDGERRAESDLVQREALIEDAVRATFPFSIRVLRRMKDAGMREQIIEDIAHAGASSVRSRFRWLASR